MEKIQFDNDTFIWKLKLNMSEYKDEILELCNDIIKRTPISKFDAYGYSRIKDDIDFLGNINVNNKIDEIAQIGMHCCIDIHKFNGMEVNMVETDSWVNVVRAKNPVQPNYVDGYEKYHIHTEINKELNSFVPSYTYVYYIQMPDNIEGDDAKLCFKGRNGKEYNILPNEDELIIMEADVPHAPNSALNSTKDRIVFAGNVGLSYIKKQKSLI